MQTFDCLALNCPLFGPHLLEASAGTGKTFSIEHIFVRLILESIQVEQILVVTFTRAATRELKARIRSNLEKTLLFLKQDQAPWDYLKPHLHSKLSTRLIEDALSTFDQCQIFTIHGFCYRMLNEFAFEAGIGSILNPDRYTCKVPVKLKWAARDFLENGIDLSLVCPEMLTLLLKQFPSMEKLIDELSLVKEAKNQICYSDLLDQFCALVGKNKEGCKTALHCWQGNELEEDRLLEDFRKIQVNYKKTKAKGDLEIQVRSFANPDYLPRLLKEKGSIFEFLDPENQKVRIKEITDLNYPGFFEWARQEIAPWIQIDPFALLQAAFFPIGKKILEEEEHFNPDDLLVKMSLSIEIGSFRDRIRAKYVAAIIDEFQDTDSLQWEIFQKLFFDLKCFYLVGDPKQSIYRFRNADIYTYLKAKQFIGEKNHYLLDTNYRSSEALIQGLNALFSREWLKLPKIGSSLAYHPVKAGIKMAPDFHDEKGSIHFLLTEHEPSFDEVFLPYAVREIERLKLQNVAILVKDRYQAQKALRMLNSRGIKAASKSSVSLGKTDSFKAIYELLKAIEDPTDRNASKIVSLGPFAKQNLELVEMNQLLEEKGLIFFAKKLELDSDGMQIFEHLFQWEKSEGFSFEGLFRYLDFLKKVDPLEGARKRVEADENAVQVMTMHISKGLEFDVVFALGLSSKTPLSPEIEEINAEKQRQLYVAMTRAKKRLYVPYAISSKKAEKGTESAIELFASHFELPFIDEIKKLSENESISMERITEKIELISKTFEKEAESPLRNFEKIEVIPSFLNSFTSLAKPKEIRVKKEVMSPAEFTMQTLPKGAETGVLIHRIFENLFSLKNSGWKKIDAIEKIVSEVIPFTTLNPWKDCIIKMVQNILSMPLHDEEGPFLLKEIDRFEVEVEFIFSRGNDFIKGFIDLLFYHKNRIYFIDWKSNWLEDYTLQSMKEAIDIHDYTLQASLYKQAIQRHFQMEFGKAYYVFVRGLNYIAVDIQKGGL